MKTPQQLLSTQTIKKDFPVIAAALRKEGAESQLNRIKAVLSVPLPGHKDSLFEMAMDGRTTAPEAALKLVKLEREKRAAFNGPCI